MRKNIIFTILSFFLLALIAEVIFTLFFIYRQNYYGPLAKLTLSKKSKVIEFRIPHDKSTGRMVPGEHYFNNNIIKINSEGFRGENFEKDNLNNCRFIALGGSTTLGINSSNPWPKILQEKINKNHDRKCEVINAGILGASLNRIENIFFSELIDFKPNYIILLSNHNSAYYDSHANDSGRPDIIDNKLDYLIFRINNFLFNNLMTYRFTDLSLKKIDWIIFKKKENLIKNPNRKNVFHSPEYFKSNYKIKIQNIINYSIKNNIQVFLIKQPRKMDYDIYKELESKNIDNLLKDFISYTNFEKTKKNNTEKFNVYSNVILNKNLDLIQKSFKDVVVIDPVEKFLKISQTEKLFLEDNLHYTQEGNNIMAEEIYKKVVNNLN